jgi:hypothetical protein
MYCIPCALRIEVFRRLKENPHAYFVVGIEDLSQNELCEEHKAEWSELNLTIEEYTIDYAISSKY